MNISYLIFEYKFCSLRRLRDQILHLRRPTDKQSLRVYKKDHE
jgi:hypothetical protein